MTADDELVAHIVERASSPGYEAWWAKVSNTGYCSTPVHLHGQTPAGYGLRILTRCKNRRAAVCPSCSALYSGDTWQLVHQGIHPCNADTGQEPVMVFATLTAPSYGPVHTTAEHHTVCRPGNPMRCEHGRSQRCLAVHGANDPQLGEPLCIDCYRYLDQVLFTWHAPQLWHRFTITLRRLVKRHDQEARVSYVKVVELQRRGVPHFHAVVRLDNTTLTTADLIALGHRAIRSTSLDVPAIGGELLTLRFGPQTDLRPLIPGSGTEDRRIASYLAKYVTKSVTEFGLSPRRISPRAVTELAVRPHIRSILVTITWVAQETDDPDMTKWLHTLGYRGHITTKTRAYSTTMGALRAQRAAWRQQQGNTANEVMRGWEFTKIGHDNDGDRVLAATADAQHRAARQAAREALTDRVDHEPG